MNRTRAVFLAMPPINFVPSMFTAFLEFVAREARELTRLRYIFCAGEALSCEQVKKAKKLLGNSVKIAYQHGPTETPSSTRCC